MGASGFRSAAQRRNEDTPLGGEAQQLRPHLRIPTQGTVRGAEVDDYKALSRVIDSVVRGLSRYQFGCEAPRLIHT